MNPKRLLYIALAIGAVAVLGAQVSFFGADELSRDRERRDQKIEANISGQASNVIRAQARSACVAEGGDDVQCDCMVKQADKIIRQSKNWGSGSSAERKFKEANDKAREACGLPALD